MTTDDKLTHKQPAYTVRTFTFNPVASSGRNPTQTGSSRGALTEFTRRKNWSQRIIDRLEDFIHVLSPQSKIMYCSPATTELFGYAPEDLIGRPIVDFIHVDDVDLFRQEFTEVCQQRRKFHLYYRFMKNDSTYVSIEMVGHPYFGDGQKQSATLPMCFFGCGKVYPNKASNAINSFLELKMEKEMLERQIREARAKKQRVGIKSTTSKESSPTESQQSEEPVSQGINEITPLPTGITEPMGLDMFQVAPTNVHNAPFVYTLGVNPQNDISEALQMFTGLRYDMGERSNGISTGSTAAQLLDPTLDLSALTGSLLDPTPIQILNPASFATQQKLEASTSDRTKRKKRTKDDTVVHVCTDCGTTESPEWRKGPKGPKTY
ncbi:hypothetical protein NQZ79_g3490 [Umbelopsis isabellina]|nr:hypothetical protein NQZ79_g3490 [Umbelopsis isabellina]